ncbi:hypothetical protein GGD81_000223 [Rhodobium orientis]|uniref:Uncharacterized protein n=1 Tax=Rhodobium orientis TaxID=34017 RepID=A0A327JWS8_9HYPH|nr:hypothetical protein [Rhodobium orientis]MBB4301208.1 hypothetical protein [Rhodobium orientis]MBK5951200.1 hypothetical protein [Rhodobium orientis]RAI30024.1 hypothetical protein CH339_00375 [Rhodobium orientis]
MAKLRIGVAAARLLRQREKTGGRIAVTGNAANARPNGVILSRIHGANAATKAILWDAEKR